MIDDSLQHEKAPRALHKDSILHPWPDNVVVGRRSSSGTNNWAKPARRGVNLRVLMNLALMMLDLSLGNGAHITVLCASCTWVVGGEDGGDGAYDGAQGIVHGLALGLVENLLQRRTLQSIARAFGRRVGDAGMLVEVVVVVGRRAHDGADLAGLGEVDVGMAGGQDRVGGADDGADILLGGRHVCVGLIEACSS